MSPRQPQEPVPSSKRVASRINTRWVLILTFLVAATVGILLPTEGNVQHGESTFHARTIHQFHKQFPDVSLADPLTATTPLFHLVMLCVVLVVGPEMMVLRAVQAAIGLATFVVVWRFLQHRIRTEAMPWWIVAFVASPYVFPYSVRLMTDLPALLFVVLALDTWYRHPAYLSQPRATSRASIAAILAASIRQSTLWLTPLNLYHTWIRGGRRPLDLAVPLAPAVAVAPLFYWWGGLVPPTLRIHQADGINWAPPFLALAILGFYGIFLAPAWAPRDRPSMRIAGWSAGAAALALLLFVVLGGLASTHRIDGVLSAAIDPLPEAVEAVTWFVLVAIGGAVAARLALLEWARRAHQTPIWLIAVPCLVASNMTNVVTFQRYLDPLLFLWIAMVAGRDMDPRRLAPLIVIHILLSASGWLLAL